MNQSVSIIQPLLPLFNRSWTFEAWIYLFNVTNWIQYPILGHCAEGTQNRSLHLVVDYPKLRFGFCGENLTSGIDLKVARWYHTAFVLDSATRNQSIYPDGIFDGSRIANTSCEGANGTSDIGMIRWSSGNQYFNDLIDQLSYTNRSKTFSEILRDATLTLFVSFDDNSTSDEGPLKIDGSLAGSTSFTFGQRGQALQIQNGPDSYFTVQGLALLGRDNRSYSFSIWINPTIRQS